MVKKSSVLSQIKSSRAFLFINNYSCNYDCNNVDGDNCNMKQGLYYITFGGIWNHSSEPCDHIIQVWDIDKNEFFFSNVRSPLKYNGFAMFSHQSQTVHLFDKSVDTRFYN